MSRMCLFTSDLPSHLVKLSSDSKVGETVCTLETILTVVYVISCRFFLLQYRAFQDGCHTKQKSVSSLSFARNTAESDHTLLSQCNG